MVRVRFAPSPSGGLHLGNLRTAIFNWVYARKNRGKFILRIEDTDQSRVVQGAEQEICNMLKFLGLDWDEFYRQSERLEIYEKYLKELEERGLIYPCFCSEEELEEERRIAVKRKRAYRYSGKCRKLTKEQVDDLIRSGKKPSYRFKVLESNLGFYDLLRAEMKISSREIGDFIVQRSSGLPTYNFSCVIDDHLMEITDVIRGEDHLYNTFYQISLYNAFGFQPPRFLHLPLLLGKDRKPLSKREGAISVEWFQKEGFLPEAIFNYLILLGWSHPGAKELLSKEEVLENFSIDRLSSSPSIFDYERLEWFNKKHIRALPSSELIKRAMPFFEKSFLEKIEKMDPKLLESAVDSIRDNIDSLADVARELTIYLPGVGFKVELGKDESLIRRFLELIDEKDNFQEILDELVRENKGDKKKTYMFVRRVITGRERGPELIKLVEILGKDEVRTRLEKALGIKEQEVGV